MALRLFDSALKHGLAPFAYGLLRTYLGCLRVRVVNEEVLLKHLSSGGRGIAAVWHQRFFPALLYALKFKDIKPCVMISQSRDGDLISPIAERLGLIAVRGSSSRGAKAATAAMLKGLKENPAAVHIVDGPRGPKGVVKPGLIRLAQVSGAAIFPLYISTKWSWVTHSWDRSLVPKPFSRVLIRWGNPMRVPSRMNQETFEAHRLKVEKMLKEGHARDDLEWGWNAPL